MFAVCAFPIHTWSILVLLRELPAWLLHLNIWDLIGTIAYSQAFALVESVVILLAALLAGALVPRKWLSVSVVALTVVGVFLTSAWLIAVQLNYTDVRAWSARSFLPWLAAYLLSMGLVCALVYQRKRLAAYLVSFADRLLILAYVYLFVDVLSVLTVVVRNAGGSAW